MASKSIQRSSHPSGASGFTLIEVLLAFVVFALCFTVVLEILSGSMRNTQRAREYTEIALIAQSVMDQVGLDIPLQAGAHDDGETGNYVGPFDGSGGNEHSIDLSQLTGIDLLEVECVISWGTYPGEHSSRFSTVKAVLANQRARGV